VDNNNKVRFSIDTVKGVKANYGHSLELPEMIMKEYRDDGIGNKRYFDHETYIKYLPKILNEGLSRMEDNHVHLCKQIGGTWIRRKKHANIVIYVDVQGARHDGLRFFSAPNDVIMCAGDENGIIPIKYFKEIKNIKTGEPVDSERHLTKKITQDKSLRPLAQNFIPVQMEERKTNNVNRPINKDEQTTPKQYCGQAYDENHAWKELELEFNDYKTEEKRKISTPQQIPTIPQPTTNDAPFERSIIKAPEYNKVTRNIDNYSLIQSTSWPQKGIINTAYHIPQTTYYNSTLQGQPATTVTNNNSLINMNEQTTVNSS